MEREQIKKALECWISEYGCTGCPFIEQGCFDCGHIPIEISKSILALINSQEQRIFELENRLKECENGYEGTLHLERAKIKQLTEERDTFRECAYNLQNYVNGIAEKQSQGYEPSAAKAAAEMEMWRVVALEKKKLTEGNERLREKVATSTILCRECHDEYDNKIKDAEADTVRKMQERLKGKAKAHYFDNCNYAVSVEDIDQIAKEMLAGTK